MKSLVNENDKEFCYHRYNEMKVLHRLYDDWKPAEMYLHELELLLHRRLHGSRAVELQVAAVLQEAVATVEDRCVLPGQPASLDTGGLFIGVALDEQKSAFYRQKYRHVQGACADPELGRPRPSPS